MNEQERKAWKEFQDVLVRQATGYHLDMARQLGCKEVRPVLRYARRQWNLFAAGERGVALADAAIILIDRLGYHYTGSHRFAV